MSYIIFNTIISMLFINLFSLSINVDYENECKFVYAIYVCGLYISVCGQI